MVDDKKAREKRCFVICPIGERDTAIRQRSDDIFEHLIRPIAQDAGYVAERVIDNDRPGDITTKIVGDIIEANVIVADITGHNPNVFYELAIAHAWKKPRIILTTPPPPFPWNNIRPGAMKETNRLTITIAVMPPTNLSIT